jgi:hypothetical protein
LAVLDLEQVELDDSLNDDPMRMTVAQQEVVTALTQVLALVNAVAWSSSPSAAPDAMMIDQIPPSDQTRISALAVTARSLADGWPVADEARQAVDDWASALGEFARVAGDGHASAPATVLIDLQGAVGRLPDTSGRGELVSQLAQMTNDAAVSATSVSTQSAGPSLSRAMDNVELRMNELVTDLIQHRRSLVTTEGAAATARQDAGGALDANNRAVRHGQEGQPQPDPVRIGVRRGGRRYGAGPRAPRASHQPWSSATPSKTAGGVHSSASSVVAAAPGTAAAALAVTPPAAAQPTRTHPLPWYRAVTTSAFWRRQQAELLPLVGEKGGGATVRDVLFWYFTHQSHMEAQEPDWEQWLKNHPRPRAYAWQVWLVGAQTWSGRQGGVTPLVGASVDDPGALGWYGGVPTVVVGPSPQRPGSAGPFVVQEVEYVQNPDDAMARVAFVHLAYA